MKVRQSWHTSAINMNILDLCVLTLGLQWWSTKAGHAWWLPQMKSGETQSSQAEIIQSVVKQNPKQQGWMWFAQTRSNLNRGETHYKDSCQGWRCWRSRSVGWRRQNLVDKSFNWLCSPLCCRWSWRSYSWCLCWQSCTLLVVNNEGALTWKTYEENHTSIHHVPSYGSK